MDRHDVFTKVVPDTLVASIRFHGTVEAIGEGFRRLWPAVKDHIAGPAICLYHSGSLEAGFDLEVAVPGLRARERGRGEEPRPSRAATCSARCTTGRTARPRPT